MTLGGQIDRRYFAVVRLICEYAEGRLPLAVDDREKSSQKLTRP